MIFNILGTLSSAALGVFSLIMFSFQDFYSGTIFFVSAIAVGLLGAAFEHIN